MPCSLFRYQRQPPAVDLNSLVTGNPSICNIDAMEDSEVLELNTNRQEEPFTDIPKRNIYWRIIMQKAFNASSAGYCSSINHRSNAMQISSNDTLILSKGYRNTR